MPTDINNYDSFVTASYWFFTKIILSNIPSQNLANFLSVIFFLRNLHLVRNSITLHIKIMKRLVGKLVQKQAIQSANRQAGKSELLPTNKK